jgi:hypothetical protein
MGHCGRLLCALSQALSDGDAAGPYFLRLPVAKENVTWKWRCIMRDI